MAPDLSEEELGVVQSGIDSIMQRVAELGLTLIVEQDFARLNAALEARGSFVNPSFDPRRSKLGGRDFWVQLLDRKGNGIGFSAERVIETDDFSELVATGRVWYAEGFKAVGGPERIELRALSGRLAGPLSHSGSTWVEPEWRRQGLAMLLARLTRALSFRNYAVNLNTGFVRHSLYVSSVPRESYGYAHVELCLDGYFPPQQGPETLYLCWIDAREFVASVRALPVHARHPVRLVRAETAALLDALPVG
jgi:hypothetical protein